MSEPSNDIVEAEAIEAEARAAAEAVRTRRRVDALLARRAFTPAPIAEPPALLTTSALAKRLGISVATVRRWENPPSICVGDESSRRYDLAEVKAWLATRQPRATTPARKPVDTESVDLDSTTLRMAGLRAVNGGKR